MAHDFILARGKLTQKQIYDAMRECVSFKHHNFVKTECEQTAVIMSGEIKEFNLEKDPRKPANKEYFHGYFNGIFYHVFNCERFNMGMSGSGEAITQNGKQVKKKIKMATDKIFFESKDINQNFYAKNLVDFCEKLTDDEILTVIFC